MALTIDFDTPESGSPRSVLVNGTVASDSVGYLTIRLDVSDKTTAAINRSFYRVITYENSGSPTLTVANASFTLSVSPKLLSTETINETTGVVKAWSYTI